MPSQLERGQTLDATPSADRERLLGVFAASLFTHHPSQLTEDECRAITRRAFGFFAERNAAIKLDVRATAHDGVNEITIETAMPDCPFIVDSIQEYFYEIDASVRVMVHPILNVSRDSQGRIVSLEEHRRGEVRESLIHAEIVLAGGAPDAAAIEHDLRQILDEVSRATVDFKRMTERAIRICDETAQLRDFVEIRDFLRWLAQGGFVFLGARRYQATGSAEGTLEFVADPSCDLGILRGGDQSRFSAVHAFDDFDPARRKLLLESSPLMIGKSRIRSHVNRRVAMDDITIRWTGRDGTLIFDRFLGLFTAKAYVGEAQHVPVLRAKLAEILSAERAIPGSHDYKALVTIFNGFPKEELFRATTEELRRQIRLILDFNDQSAVRLSIQSDPERGHVIALVILKREDFSAEVRLKIQELLAQRLGGPLIYYYLALAEARTARLHFSFAAKPPPAAIIPELEREIAMIARSWDERLQDRLIGIYGAAGGMGIARRWARAFDANYQTANSIDQAAADIACVEEIFDRAEGIAVTVEPPGGANEPARIRLYEAGSPPLLSDLMPRLQNFGLRVISEDAHQLTPESRGVGKLAFVQVFRVEHADLKFGMDTTSAARIAEAFRAVSAGLAEDDPLNELTISARLGWRDVALLRTIGAAAFQMRLAPSRPALNRVLVSHPALAAALADLFKARLDPGRNDTAEQVAAIRTDYLGQLAGVEAITDDRAARALLSMVDAAVRTNFFGPVPAPDPYIAIKFESGKILNLPDLPPLYEIHVVSPRMAGCHLRAGRIARGGIRYSDRPDDYRTEILDLMKTQTVKNAIIVPIGSKGGFIVKSRSVAPPGRNDVVAAYKTLIRGMLDLTDNLVDGMVAHPVGIKVLDGADPYLVVAADKGTAAFSDIANDIAIERAFWLGDAFASGGEHGYDHKALGITARGAWESAKRHLRELGRDPDRGAPITVVGIGDMSGDVFGNGMLQSRNLKLIAAFDHRHIFIDPDPDTAVSYKERSRLFELPGSQWSDYNPHLISRGGGIYRRGQKRIELTPEARSVLGCDVEALDGESLIRAILRADVDMIYNGGIGTYVRAESETDAEVADHANDSCRVVANELRARIVVEGGNLGLTQQARIEYALKGGMINTDAIDNSAGVDCSDHEVNLKILLDPAVRRGELAVAERNGAIAGCADEIAGSVLCDNRDQALSLSLEHHRSITGADFYRQHMSAIGQRGIIRVHDLVLPAAEELQQRSAANPGLTRPELALVTAYTKIELKARLENTAFIDDPYLVEAFLKPYFPAKITARFAADLPGHRLRRQLITAEIVNELVDLGGSILVFSLNRNHGAEAAEAVRAWLISAGVLDLRQRSERLRAATATLDANSELRAFSTLADAAQRVSGWILARGPAGPIGPIVNRLRPQYESLSDQFESILAGTERERYEQTYRDLRAAVQREEIAHDLARLALADHLLAVLELAFERNLSPMAVGQAYFGMSKEFDFATLERALAAIDGDEWARRAARDIELELDATRLEMASLALSGSHGCEGAVNRLKEMRPREFAVAQKTIADVKALPNPGVPALQVAVRWLTRLARTSWRPGD